MEEQVRKREEAMNGLRTIEDYYYFLAHLFHSFNFLLLLNAGCLSQ